jgi:hypothetical protein
MATKYLKDDATIGWNGTTKTNQHKWKCMVIILKANVCKVRKTLKGNVTLVKIFCKM